MTPAWDNLDDFLSTDDFATLAVFTPAGGAARPPVAGIFEEQYQDMRTGEFVMMGGDPRFTCKAADVAGLKRHDDAVIDGVAYALTMDPAPDGTGMARVYLARA